MSQLRYRLLLAMQNLRPEGVPILRGILKKQISQSMKESPRIGDLSGTSDSRVVAAAVVVLRVPILPVLLF